MSAGASSRQPLVWGLIDDRPGTANQVRGVVEQLNFPFEIKRFTFTGKGNLPNALRGFIGLGIDENLSDRMVGPWPDIVVAAGRKLAPVSLHLQKKRPGAYLSHLMGPEMPLGKFDLVALPLHDQTQATKKSANVLHTLGAPHALTKAKLEKAAEAWTHTLGGLPKPRVAVLIGGDTDAGKLQETEDEALLQWAAKIAGSGSLFVSTSRRTPEKLARHAKHLIGGMQHHFHAFGDRGKNPYEAYLALADTIIVTGDSVSMASEACVTGRSVYVWPTGAMAAKHNTFIAMLMKEDHVRMQERFDYAWRGGRSLNEAERVAGRIRADWVARKRGAA